MKELEHAYPVLRQPLAVSAGPDHLPLGYHLDTIDPLDGRHPMGDGRWAMASMLFLYISTSSAAST
jgi:hypothetical protein